MGPVLGYEQLLKRKKSYFTFSLQSTFHFSEMTCALSAVLKNAPIRLNASKDPNIIWIFNELKEYSLLCVIANVHDVD